MRICANNLVIRNITTEDMKMLKNITQEEIISKYLPFAYSYIECFYDAPHSNGLYLAIENADGIMIGVIVAIEDRPNQLEISYFMAKEFRGKGYMKSAMRAFFNWVKKEGGYRSLSFKIHNKNIASISFVTSLGGELAFSSEENSFYFITV